MTPRWRRAAGRSAGRRTDRRTFATPGPAAPPRAGSPRTAQDAPLLPPRSARGARPCPARPRPPPPPCATPQSCPARLPSRLGPCQTSHSHHPTRASHSGAYLRPITCRSSRDGGYTVRRWRCSRESSSASTEPSGDSTRSARHSPSHQEKAPRVDAVTALDTAPAARAGFDARRWVDILTEEATTARDTAARILDDRRGSTARVVRGKPVDVLRRACEEANATLLALGGRKSSRFLGIVLGDTVTELVHDGTCSVLRSPPSGWRGMEAGNRRRRSRWLPVCSCRARDRRRDRSPARRSRRERLGDLGRTQPAGCRLGRQSRQLGSSASGRCTRGALSKDRPRRRRLTWSSRHPRDRERQRARRTPSQLLRPCRPRRFLRSSGLVQRLAHAGELDGTAPTQDEAIAAPLESRGNDVASKSGSRDLTARARALPSLDQAVGERQRLEDSVLRLPSPPRSS